ncbi:MAG: YihY/virulence factor BrkB family protein, partial [Bacteroidales bacterium]|nr:YihY/virulence factor BrkB family protein [Bacteroidales bacterium]
MTGKFGKIQKFIQEEIWRTPLADKSARHSFLIRQLRIIVLAFRGFLEDRVSMRASALTFYTLLSLVPIVAMGFGVAKGFGFQNRMEEFIMQNFKGQEEVLNWVIDLSYTVLEGVQGGLLAGIGLIILIWSVMQVLTNIENSFNAIWQIRKPRSFFRKLADYLSIILIGPLLIIVSSSLMVYISTRVESAAGNVIMFQMVTPAIQKLLGLIPYALIWMVFTLVYIVMPNTKVNFKYALIAGILAGTTFQITQWAYLHFQIGVSKYSAIYGTFAALPLFLIWLQISWLIVLLGAEISFAYQNVGQYELEAGSLQISNHNKRVLSLLITHHIVKNFEEGNEPLTSSQLSSSLGIPIRLVREILFDLTQAKILVETVTDSPKEKGHQPAIDINKITLQFVIERLDDIGND